MKESKFNVDFRKLFRQALLGWLIANLGMIFLATLATALFACGVEREMSLLISIVITIPLYAPIFVKLINRQLKADRRSHN